jgi:thiamine biosynthesis lipoprotein
MLWALTATLLCIGCAQPTQDWQLDGQTMGTRYSISVAGCPHSTCNDDLAEKIETLLKAFSRQTSHYDPESELSLFNAHHSTDWFPVSGELATVVTLALGISEISKGAFDITVAPAVNAWGFGATAANTTGPEDEILAQALRHSGWQKLSVNEAGSALRKADPLIKIDLSAIAKGYAVDLLSYQLELNSLNNYLVEIGGEIRTAGLRADGKPWRIGIEPPTSGLDISFIVTPGDKAIATSGDYINFRIVDGDRIAHTIDPGTARPVQSGLASVSVIDMSASKADALATALMVMGPDKGQAFAAKQGLPVLFLVRDGDAIRPVLSADFESYLATD